MSFSWFANRRRRKLLAQPFPDAWLTVLQRNVLHYRYLADEERSRLRDDLRVFVAEKYWEGCGGLTLTEEMQVTIAAGACLLTLNIEDEKFPRVQTILVYPTSFVTPHKRHMRGGVVSEGGINSGEAWYRGPVILSWADALAGSRGLMPGHNLVLHEFAHALDMMDGLVNGTPPLKNAQQYQRWHDVMTTEFQRLIGRAQRGEPTLLDQYGVTNVGEFFSVATECFFELGDRLKAEHPLLYDVLRGYYRQDPASRPRW